MTLKRVFAQVGRERIYGAESTTWPDPLKSAAQLSLNSLERCLSAQTDITSWFKGHFKKENVFLQLGAYNNIPGLLSGSDMWYSGGSRCSRPLRYSPCGAPEPLGESGASHYLTARCWSDALRLMRVILVMTAVWYFQITEVDQNIPGGLIRSKSKVWGFFPLFWLYFTESHCVWQNVEAISNL